jgi:hypothetical protein
MGGGAPQESTSLEVSTGTGLARTSRTGDVSWTYWHSSSSCASVAFGECTLYPLFDDALLALLRDRVPLERHDRIAQSVFVRARRPADGERLPGRARETTGPH